MTREEAIKMLNFLAIDTTGNLAGEQGDDAEFLVRVVDALDMAIAALREQCNIATNLQPESSYEQVTEPLRPNGFSDSETILATKNQVKGIRMMSRPWQPQDLLDDLQLIIDEEPDHYINDRRTTLCMARDFLKEHFREDTKMIGWISVKDRLPEVGVSVLALDRYGNIHNRYMYRCGDGGAEWTAEHLVSRKDITHWMPLPEPPKEDET